MFDKYLNIDATQVDEETVKKAYTMLKEYCDENNLNIVEFVSNKDNIAPGAEHIHKNLPFATRMLVKKERIEKMIVDNLGFIQEKAQEFYDAENPKKAVKKETVKKETPVKAAKTTKKKSS